MLSFQQAILLFLLKGSHDCSEVHQRGCHARTVNETVLENVVVQAINTLLGDRSTYQAQLQQNIAKIIREAQKNTADGIDGQLMELQKELLKKATNCVSLKIDLEVLYSQSTGTK